MYDIIGDIHGYCSKMEQLLTKMNYVKKNGVWKHPERKAIFVGDYIDRGPEIREVLYLVKRMSDAGAAYALLGNHEYNALAFDYHSPQGGHIRKHSIKNMLQHYETIKQFQGFEEEWKDYLAWFANRPLFLELDGIRVVHACWDDDHIAAIKLRTFPLSKEELLDSHVKKTSIYDLYDHTLKGKELKLPDGHSFPDKDGHPHTECRTRWWLNPEGLSLTEYLFDAPSTLAGYPIPDTVTDSGYASDQVPVFFGHYWLDGKTAPVLQAPNVCCLDYSVAKNGYLVAYRWSGEQKLKPENFIYC